MEIKTQLNINQKVVPDTKKGANVVAPWWIIVVVFIVVSVLVSIIIGQVVAIGALPACILSVIISSMYSNSKKEELESFVAEAIKSAQKS